MTQLLQRTPAAAMHYAFAQQCSTANNREWSPGGGTPQQLSVVTTVWGVTASSQSEPHHSTTTTSFGIYPQSGPGNGPHKGPNVPHGYHHRQATPPYPSNGCPNGVMSQPHHGTGPGDGSGGQYGAPPSALSTAAMVATATATATASVVALQERQDMNQQFHMLGQQQYDNMVQQYGQRPSMGPGAMMGQNPPNMMPKGSMQQGHQGANMYLNSPNPRRMAPYPTAGMHMSQKRQQHQQMPQQHQQMPQQYQGGGGFNGGHQYPYQQQQQPPPQPQQHQHQRFPIHYPQQSVPVSQSQQQQQQQQHNYGMGSRIRQNTPPYPQGMNQGYFSGGQMVNNGQYGQYGAPQSQVGPVLGPQGPPTAPPPQPHPQHPHPHQQHSHPHTQHPHPHPQQHPPQPQHPHPQPQQQQQQPVFQQFQQEISQRSVNYQHSPIPGNPTPPLTPASSLPPYISPNQDVKPNLVSDLKPSPDMKPPLPVQNDELRLTFPVRDGIILPPFRLEHNLAVSNHVFQLKPTVHQTLMWRNDLELQLKCFHHEDRQMSTNWPASVQVSVNATPLNIDRGENKTSHKPLYLKDVCQAGRNTIQITVSACCCSHLFVLQLVHRPSVRSVLQGLLRKRLLMADHCISKIKRNFSNSASNAGGIGQMDGVEQTALKVSLKCPITFKKILLPARGHDCKHIQCFDLESYLQLNCERGSWRCPVCNKSAQLEGLEVDQYIWAILSKLGPNSEAEEITIDAQANWKTAKHEIKAENDSDDSCGARRHNKMMSPGSLTLPTTNNWDMTQVMSPYLPPDMNSIASGSMMNTGPPAYNSNGMSRTGYEVASQDISHLNEPVNSLDPLNAMEKSLNDQMPHTPHTPGAVASTPGQANTPGGGNSGPPSVPPASDTSLTGGGPSSSGGNNSMQPLADSEIPSDLNFDPAAVIDGEGAGQEALNLLPDNVVDPMELLSYLDPPDLATPPSSGSSSTGANGTPGGNTTSDDILALFE